MFSFPLVPPLTEDAATEAEVVRLIVATLGRALGHDRPIVGVTDPSRSLDRSRRRNRRKNQRNLINPTRGRKKKVRAQGLGWVKKNWKSKKQMNSELSSVLSHLNLKRLLPISTVLSLSMILLHVGYPAIPLSRLPSTSRHLCCRVTPTPSPRKAL